jgi:hypothetical protein
MSFNNSTWRWTVAFAALFLWSQDLRFWDAAIHFAPGDFRPRIYQIVLVGSASVVLGSLPGRLWAGQPAW